MGKLVSIAADLLAADAVRGRMIAGVDEVGRGALAGSIAGAVVAYDTVAVAAALDSLWEVRDSKRLSAKHRESAAAAIREAALGYAIFEYPNDDIDRLGIQACNRGLIDAAVTWAEGQGCDALVVDGTIRPSVAPSAMSVYVEPKADGHSLAVASASIVAKVFRDATLRDAEYTYPGYGFLRNAGYGSPEHIDGLRRLGPCPLHRRSFLGGLLDGGEDVHGA